jgi:hypothetical protein
MPDGSRQQGQGIRLATNSFTKQDCIFLASPAALPRSDASRPTRRDAKILKDKYGLKTSVLKVPPRSPEREAAGEQPKIA